MFCITFQIQVDSYKALKMQLPSKIGSCVFWAEMAILSPAKAACGSVQPWRASEDP